MPRQTRRPAHPRVRRLQGWQRPHNGPARRQHLPANPDIDLDALMQEVEHEYRQLQRKRKTKTINKAQTIKLLDMLNVPHAADLKFNQLKRLLFNEIPDYVGKRTYEQIKTHVNAVIADRLQEAAHFADFFNQYQTPRERLGEQIDNVKTAIVNKLNNHNDYTADLSTADNETQKTHLYGLLDALKQAKLSFGQRYLLLRLDYGDGLEIMRTISFNTLAHIRNLIDVFNGSTLEAIEGMSDSDKELLRAFKRLHAFHLEWHKGERPHKAGGYFPYYNKCTELDLSPFGIYHNQTEANYDDNCFIIAAINSNLFTPDEIEHMRALVSTRYIPRDDLDNIAKLFKVTIYTAFYNEQRKKIDKPVIFNKGCSRLLRLLIRCGHYMLYHDELVPANKYDAHNLNTLITRMLADNAFELIDDLDHAERFMLYEYEFENLDYSESCIRKLTPSKDVKPFDAKHIFTAIIDDGAFVVNHYKARFTPAQLVQKLPTRSLVYMPNLLNVSYMFSDVKAKVTPYIYRQVVQQIKLFTDEKTITLRSFVALTSINYTGNLIYDFTSTVNHVKSVLRERLRINLDYFSTLPKIAYESALRYGCFDDVYAVSGKVQAFAKRCIRGGLVRTLYDESFEATNVTCLDVNSSYGASMRDMDGLPRGKPKPFTHQIPPDAVYAFAQVNISNIQRDELGRYGFIQEGINFVDTVLLDEIKLYTSCTIDIINGYYYNEGLNTKLCEFAQMLYNLRSIEGMNKLGKNLLASLYGKSLQSCQQFKTVMVKRSDFPAYLAEYGNYIFEVVRRGESALMVKLMRSINMNFNLPAFGVQVLSESRRRMDRTISFCNAHGIPIYAIKTDSFAIPSDKVNELTALTPIGTELGSFKIEYEATHVKYISSANYVATLVDGSTRIRGNV